MNIQLALKINRLIHNECKDVPHDIGLRIMELIDNEQEPEPIRIHYESKKEESDWIKYQIKKPDYKRQVIFKISSNETIEGYYHKNLCYNIYDALIIDHIIEWKYKDAELKEETDWISVEDKMPPLHIEGNLLIVKILGEDNVTMEGYYCHIFGLWMTINDKAVHVTHWKYKNK
jgi:hypothetical protein